MGTAASAGQRPQGLVQPFTGDELDRLSRLLCLEADKMENLWATTTSRLKAMDNSIQCPQCIQIRTPCRGLECTRRRTSWTPVPPKHSFSMRNLVISPAAISCDDDRWRLRLSSDGRDEEEDEDASRFSKYTIFASVPPGYHQRTNNAQADTSTTQIASHIQSHKTRGVPISSPKQ